MTEYDIRIGKATVSERETQTCTVCGYPCIMYGQIEDNVFYFCDEHKHLATRENLIAEFERIED